ncbi:MAG: hypothetical protein E6L01_07575, partial [Thaumarchaeota archaeon]
MTGKKEDRSYFSVQRKRRKRITIISILIAVPMSITLGLLFLMSGPALPNNQMVSHNHATLRIISNGVVMTVPAHIGMEQVGKAEDPLLYADHSLDKYGMQGMSP